MSLTKKALYSFAFFAVMLFTASHVSAAVDITIETPRGGFTTKQVIVVRGQVTGFNENRAVLAINGVPQWIPLNGGRFAINSVMAPGLNIVEVRAGDASKRVSFYARVPRKDIKVVLTWDTPSYVDLWVIDPTGVKCYWAAPVSPNGGNLVYDDSTFAPQTFTMLQAIPGSYTIQVQNYSSWGHPVSRVNVFVILYEGTSRERRSEYHFVMTKPRQVYHITDFSIEENE